MFRPSCTCKGEGYCPTCKARDDEYVNAQLARIDQEESEAVEFRAPHRPDENSIYHYLQGSRPSEIEYEFMGASRGERFNEGRDV